MQEEGVKADIEAVLTQEQVKEKGLAGWLVGRIL